MRLVTNYFAFTLWPDGAPCGVVDRGPPGPIVRPVHIEVRLTLPPGGIHLNYQNGRIPDLGFYQAQESAPIVLTVGLTLPKGLRSCADARRAKAQEMLGVLRTNPGCIHPALSNHAPTEPPGESGDPWHDGFTFVYALSPPSVQPPHSRIIDPRSLDELLDAARAIVTYLTERFRELYALDFKDELTLTG